MAQGAEAGEHRGMFLAEAVARRVRAMALVPQVADAVHASRSSLALGRGR